MLFRPWLVALPLLLLTGCSGRGCEGETSTPAGESALQPDIVLVVVNGLRAEAFGDGAADALLAGLGREPSTRFGSAYAQSIQPHVSMASLLTGRYAGSIPICGPPASGSQQPWCVEIPDTRQTLPEVLGIYGYRTALAVAGGSGLSVDALSGGFDQVITLDRPFATSPPRTDRWAPVEQWWGDEGDQPRFLMLSADLDQTNVEGRLRDYYQPWDAADAGQERYLEAHPEFRDRLRPGMLWPFLDRDAVDAIHGQYRSSATAAGGALDLLLDSLLPQDEGGSRESWLMVTSLHGVTLGETAGTCCPEQLRAGSHIVLLDRTLRVPLWVFAPDGGRSTAVVTDPVELVDITPTLLGLAGARPIAGLSGQDLLGEAALDDAHAYAEFGDMLALRQGDLLVSFRSQEHGITSIDPVVDERLYHWAGLFGERHLNRDARDNARSLDREIRDARLHDVATDPLQTEDLDILDHPALPHLADQLYDLRRGPGAPPAQALSRERIDELRETGALHYW
jgi:arylsulfatase A-like enzyme